MCGFAIIFPYSMARQTDRKRQQTQRLGVEDADDHDVAMEETAGPSNTAKKRGKNGKPKSSNKGKHTKQVERHEDNDPEHEDTDPEYEASTEADSDDSSA